MATYSFVTRWRAEAPIDRVFDVIADSERWPGWWRGVRSVELLERGDDSGLGWLHRYEFRSALPYSLIFDVRTTDVQRPVRLAGESSGELVGSGIWTLTADGTNATRVRYDWNIATTRWWMNLLAPVSRRAFTWNHDVIMDWGREGLARELGAVVENEEP